MVYDHLYTVIIFAKKAISIDLLDIMARSDTFQTGGHLTPPPYFYCADTIHTSLLSIYPLVITIS